MRVTNPSSAAFGVAAALTTSTGAYAYTGPARYVLDWDSVWLPLDANEFGIRGGRRVKNLYLNSDAPDSWLKLAQTGYTSAGPVDGTLPSGAAGRVHEIVHVPTDSKSNYFYNWLTDGSEPGDQPPSIFASRLQCKLVSVASGNVKPQPVGRTTGSAIGSESNNPTVPDAPLGVWQKYGQSAEQFEWHAGYAATIGTLETTAKTYQVCQIQFEDLAGHKTPYPGEYVPSGATAGIQWFTTLRDVTGWAAPIAGVFTAANVAYSAGGTLVDGGNGAALSGVQGVQIEPAATNVLSGWNAPCALGYAVLDAASTNYSFTAPATAGSAETYLDPRSMRFLYNKTDIALVNSGALDRIQRTGSTDLAALCAKLDVRVGHSIWLHVAGVGQQGPFVIGAISAAEITLTSNGTLVVRSAGTATNIARCPAVGENVALRRNDNSWHYSTVSAVLLPTLGALAIDGYQHESVRVTLADALPNDGIHGAISGTNNDQPFYYYKPTDQGITIAGGTGPTLRLVADGMVAAGLGYLHRHNLVWEFYGGTSGNATFSFPSVSIARPSVLSAYARRTAGAGLVYMKLTSHAGEVNTNSATYVRLVSTVTAVGVNYAMVFTIPSGVRANIALPQMEQAAAGETAITSSPILTRGAVATRSTGRLRRNWGVTTSGAGRFTTAWKSNDFTASFTFTPGAGPLAQKQTLWSVYVDASNYFELALAGSTLTATKRISGVSYTATTAYTPVAGTAVALTCGLSSTTGINLSVNGTPATPTATNLLDMPFAAASSEDIGSLNGANVAFGAFKDVVVT